MAKLHLRFYIKKSELFNDDINLSVHMVSLNSDGLVSLVHVFDHVFFS